MPYLFTVASRGACNARVGRELTTFVGMVETSSRPALFSVRQTPGGALVKAWDHGVPMEDDVWKQVDNLAAVPGVERVAIMPDAHIGHGACVGSAILTRDIVIPAAVGVDIGCGMIAAPLNIRRSALTDLPRVRAEIEARIPVGRTNQGQAGDRGAWGDAPEDVLTRWWGPLADGYREMVEAYPTLKHPFVTNHLGTLGTGNHFIEVCVEDPDSDDEDKRVWIMLHSGSRGIGNKIGTGFMKLAQKEMERWHIRLRDPELAYLPRGTTLFSDYLKFAHWAQNYAWQSRLLMFRRTLEAIRSLVPEADYREDLVHCHHNYVAEERHFGKPGLLTRKGAVNAEQGTMGIIPGSMGTRSYITRGKGNPEALMTSSHGAGRVMSRNVARKSITMEQHVAALNGVECRMDADVIDESPAAYKDVDAVMRAQSDLTEAVVTLKQIVVVKG
jgi:tRNA-splicing ligase RtcB (3'-phosphate/5'-hydroxy nucleic acid ligase)